MGRASLKWVARKIMNYERATCHLGCDSQVAQVEGKFLKIVIETGVSITLC
jgi:hypothetical protein